MKVCAVSVMLGLVLCVAAGADDVAVSMRAIVAANDAAVVTVKVALKESYSMEEYGSDVSEYTQEVSATVITAEGLMVTSFMQVDPTPYMEELYGGEDGVDSKTEVTSLKIMRDGADVDAEIVLRDRDLDLAFLRPVKKPEAPWAFIDLSTSVTAAAFDPAVAMRRLGKVARRVASADLVRIAAVSDKPRTFYIMGEYPGEGTPSFLLSGECLGITVTKLLKASSQNGMGVTDDYDMNLTSVIIPGPEILEIAQQVPAYKTE